jgi:hypothetical protein
MAASADEADAHDDDDETDAACNDYGDGDAAGALHKDVAAPVACAYDDDDSCEIGDDDDGAAQMMCLSAEIAQVGGKGSIS